MSRWFLVRSFLISAAAILIALASPAIAGEGRGGEDPGPPPSDNGGGGEGEGEGGDHETSVPEFDPSTAGAAFALLCGGALVLTSRRKRRLAS